MALALGLACAACTTTHVAPVDAARHRLGEVCIERNPRVHVAALVPAVRDAFRRHRVMTRMREPGELAGCEYVLRYNAERGGATAYMKSATLELTHGDEAIGRVEYAHRGGLAITKYARTADKLDPLIDRLLEGQRR
jgi:hypothetical protein